MSDAILSAPNIQATPNYTKLMAEDRFFKGYLGEWAFTQVLRQRGAWFSWEPRYDGIPDTGADVVAKVKGRPCPIDIKTAGQTWHRSVMVPAAQVDRYLNSETRLIVGARCEGNQVRLFGAIPRAQLLALPVRYPGDGGRPGVHVPTLVVPLSGLPLGMEFINYFDEDLDMAFEQKPNSGSLFRNADKEDDSHADYNGSALIDGQEFWINGWINEIKSGQMAGKTYLNLKFKPKQQSGRSSRGQASRGGARDEMGF